MSREFLSIDIVTTSMLDYLFAYIVAVYAVSLFDYLKVTWSEFKPLWDRLDFIFDYYFGLLVRKEFTPIIIIDYLV